MCGLGKEKLKEIKKLAQMILVDVRTGMGTQVSQF